MAANRSTNKITVILIYAVLEWTLIFLLLLNSFFSHLILRFSSYFGLNPPPCPWCTTTDMDLLCELHAKEVSSLVFCLNHHKLVKSRDLCPNCLPKNEGEPHNQCGCCGLSSAMAKVCTSDQHLEFCLDYTGTTLVVLRQDEAIVDDFDINVVPDCSFLEMEEDDCSVVFHLKTEEIANFTAFRWPDATRETCSCDNSDYEEVAEQGSNGNEADVSIGTEIPDLDITEEIQAQDCDCIDEASSACDSILSMEQDCKKTEEQMVELQTLSVNGSDHEMNEIEEDKLLTLEGRDSSTEDSIDGSVMSDLEGGEGVFITVESLKSALREERKALQALYVELEEERSASAVAANQTMAMINRLQEEKAAMQMEAMQYQRMMEEQLEYDHEAMQLLNEVMAKQERELEGCQKKLEDYKARDKMRMSRGSVRSGLSSASCSEDSDGILIDLNLEAKEEDDLCSYARQCGNGSAAAVGLEESLADFDDERLSILEQLKVLEERLLSLDDEKEQHFEDVHAMQDCNGNLDEEGHFGPPNESTKGRLTIRAISDDIGINGSSHGSYEMPGDRRIAIEEEVDHLYERLEALESNREFLKHCIGSLRKGDKGTNLPREILQHLCDLRSAELQVRDHHMSSIGTHCSTPCS